MAATDTLVNALARRLLPADLYKEARAKYGLYLRFQPLATSLWERLSLARFFLWAGPAGADTRVRVRGRTFVMGRGTTEIFDLEDLWSGHHYDRLEQFVPNSEWIVLDVGANIGTFSVYAAHHGATVYAFEPNPVCYRRLCATILANDQATRVQTLNLAVGDSPGRGHIAVPGEGRWTPAGRLVRDEDEVPIGPSKSQAMYRVQVTSLDAVLSMLGIKRIDLLKIDTEGAEADVLRGAATILDQVERIVIEYHSRDLLNEVMTLLEAHCFTVALQESLNPNDPAMQAGVLYAARTTTL
jgi:FkbM family methyltransferase